MFTFAQVMALTCDNADNNKTMINEMVNLIPGYRGHDMRVRCFGHVLNLIVKVRSSLHRIYVPD